MNYKYVFAWSYKELMEYQEKFVKIKLNLWQMFNSIRH